jgi:hypothetical protein
MTSRTLFLFASFAALSALGCGSSHDSATISIQIESDSDLTGQRLWGGRVVSDPPGIDCARVGNGPTTGSCTMSVSDQYTAHDVLLRAEPDPNSAFSIWINTSSGADFEGPLMISDQNLALIAESGRSYSYQAMFGLALNK